MKLFYSSLPLQRAAGLWPAPSRASLCISMIVALTALAGCPLTHDDPEPTKCRASEDCFRGEWCDMANDPKKVIGECRPYLDSGILDKGPRPPDMKPTPDAPLSDLLDAGPTPDGDLGAPTEQGAGDLGDQGASQ